MNRTIEFLMFIAMLLKLVTPALCNPAINFYNLGVARQAKGDLDSAMAHIFAHIVDWSKRLAPRQNEAIRRLFGMISTEHRIMACKKWQESI
jgi:hypothetical protein